jgi:putative sigma-54 modulation protein
MGRERETTKAAVRERFAHEEYPIHVIGRHLHVTDAMKAYAVDKMTAKLKRYGARVVDATVTMDIQWIVHVVDFLIDVNNIKIKVSGKSENMYNSVDQAIDRLDAKLSKYLRRIHEHRAVPIPALEMAVQVIERIEPIDEINDQIEEENQKKAEVSLKPHSVVSQEKCELKTLTQEEAIMKMELSNDAFLLYVNEVDRKIKVIYRRSDGNYGIIDTQV